nr:MAG TPA: hypothetical protein [Caudoviricetes sp.]
MRLSNKNNNSPRRTRELLLLLILPNHKHNFERRFVLHEKNLENMET